MQTDGKAKRYNAGKPRFDLIPLQALVNAAKVFEFGEGKYGRNNWTRGMEWSKMIASLVRHIAAFQAGEDMDMESGHSHVGAILCNAIMLSWYFDNFKAGDDRMKKQNDEVWTSSDLFYKLWENKEPEHE